METLSLFKNHPFLQIEENTRVLEKLGQRGSTAGYASRSVAIITIVFLCIVIIVIIGIVVVIITIVLVCIVIIVIVIAVVMMFVSALMTTVLCAREASAGKLKSAGRLEPKRLCCNGCRLR